MKIYHYTTGPIEVNTYLVYDDTKKGFIVDPGGFRQDIIQTIEQEGIEIQYILLTHGHADHIGGVKQFKSKYPNAEIIALDLERELLENPMLNASPEIFGENISVNVDKYVHSGDTLTVGNTELRFVHTPGHTKGGMSIIMKGYVFSGDTLFRASIGRTDFYGGDFAEIISSIKNILFQLPDETKVLPGHMGETTIGYEKEHNPFV